MKTSIIAVAAATLLAVSAGAAQARSYYNVESLVARGADEGEIIVALDLTCRTGGNFVMQTNRYANQTYRGCAFRDYDRVVIYWDDGARVSYASSVFRRTTADLRVF